MMAKVVALNVSLKVPPMSAKYTTRAERRICLPACVQDVVYHVPPLISEVEPAEVYLRRIKA